MSGLGGKHFEVKIFAIEELIAYYKISLDFVCKNVVYYNNIFNLNRR